MIKLKGLPMNADADSARKPSLYANDLSVDVTLGFACFHIVLGLMSTTFGLVFLLAFDQADEWRASTEGIGCGIIFLFTGCIGLWAANERKHCFAKANDSIKIFLLASFLSILTAASFILLTAAGVTTSSATDSARTHLIFHLTLTLLFEMCNSLLSGLTSAKIIWPLRFNFYTRKWPTQSKVTKKVIVSTSILARGLYQSPDFQRSLGPHCVVSLAPPPPPPPPPRSPKRLSRSRLPSDSAAVLADQPHYGSTEQSSVCAVLRKQDDDDDGSAAASESPPSATLHRVD